MKRLFGSTLALAALLTLLPSCDQPKASCTAGVGAFAAKYTFKAGTKTGQGSCDTLQGEVLGLSKYNPLKEGEKTVQDLTKASLVIRSSTLGDLAVGAGSVMVSDAAHDPNSTGKFVSTVPDENDVCSVPQLSSAAQQLPMFTTPPDPATCMYDNNGTVMEIARPIENYPATNIKYDWSNVRLYVTAAYPGTQMVGDLTYTDADSNCTASYSVIGLWPAIRCRVVVNDKDGNPTCDKDGNLITKLDPALCDPIADPAAGRPTGSGINPDLTDRLTCDDATGLCVLTRPPDALK